MAKKIAFGLSVSSWLLLQRLQQRNHVDKLALSPGAASCITNLPKNVLIGPAFELLTKHWEKGTVFLIVGSLGSVIRLVAPLLENKDIDPAVIVLDSKASQVVPLLSCHKGGAQDLAIQIAEDLGAKVVITGDSWIQGRIPLDSFGESWGWKRTGDRNLWHQLMIQQSLGHKTIFFQSSGSNLWQTTRGASNSLNFSGSELEVSSVPLSIGPELSHHCCWHPATLWIGVGCERNTSRTLIERSLQAAFAKAGLAQEAVAGMATLDNKFDESALIDISKNRKWPIRFFAAAILSSVLVPNPSEIVKDEVGTPSVAEAAALLAAGEESFLRQKKTIYHSSFDENGAVTIAIAEAKNPFSPERGELHLVGSGPGELSFLTHDARQALSRSAIWIGYGLYLDFLEPLRRHDQACIRGELTREKDRCQQALDLAMEGVRVALVSSGDSGIYGMAGLALELLLRISEDQRPKFFVHPGISAIQIAASRLGAPIMNDFCVVSLSDRLTPWNKIEERLLGAAIGDFVIALYNPKSKDRNWQLKKAINLLLQYRSADTPVALARQVSRPSEKVDIYSLDAVPLEVVDMFTIVLIGNSLSRINDGWFLTPRGYEDTLHV